MEDLTTSTKNTREQYCVNKYKKENKKSLTTNTRKTNKRITCKQIQKRKQIEFDNKHKEEIQENNVSTNKKKKTNRF